MSKFALALISHPVVQSRRDLGWLLASVASPKIGSLPQA
jgi:hypothetical protein